MRKKSHRSLISPMGFFITMWFFKKTIDEQIEQYCKYRVIRYPTASLTNIDEFLHDFVKHFKIKDVHEITKEKITEFEQKVFDEHSTFFSLEAGKVVRNFAKYFKVVINTPEVALQTESNTISNMNQKEKLLKEIMAENGRKSWEARKKKYGAKGARKFMIDANLIRNKKLSTA